MSETSDPQASRTPGDACAASAACQVPLGTPDDDRLLIHEGDQIFLRTITAGDKDEFVALVKASRKQFRRWLQMPTEPSHFGHYMRAFDEGHAVGFVVCLRATGAIAGFVNIRVDIDPMQRFFYGELGYGTFDPHQKRGYMTEALALAINYGFAQLRLYRVEAYIQPENTESLRLAEKLGLRKEGSSFKRLHRDWREHELWAITKE